MCTSLSFKTKDHYFGRNLDYEFSYNETVTITPRNFILKFRQVEELKTHYALIGMAYVCNNYPLYYDATNEMGLSIAGLNFPKFAYYHDIKKDKTNLASFELIPYILGKCKNVSEAKSLLENINIYLDDFSSSLPSSPLHWMIADKDCSIVVESTKDGLKIYDNPVNVMTNSPTFDFHLLNLTHYMGITSNIAKNNFTQQFNLEAYSRGNGSFGLPGDLSSASRFVRAAFTLNNSKCGDSEEESVGHFMRILNSVAQQKGCCQVEHGYEYTIYSSCCNTSKGIYYYTTYNNQALIAVDMHKVNLDCNKLFNYPLKTKQLIIQDN